MNKRVFGFDLGIASIGWSVIDFFDETENDDSLDFDTGKIVDCGVRIFTKAEDPKTQLPLAGKRREQRLSRRTIRRKARRMLGLRQMFIAKKLCKDFNQLEAIYKKQESGDVWDLRVKALSEKLTKDELIRVLTHLAKHRGFKSYKSSIDVESSSDDGKVLKAIKANLDEFNSKYKTFAQMIVSRAEFNVRRNKQGSYINSIPRDKIEEELAIIYEVQNQYGIFTKDIYDDFKKIAFRHRPIGSVENMVGYCTFEALEKRAPKESPSAQMFVALSKINNLSLDDNGVFRKPSVEEIDKIINLLKTVEKVKYSTIKTKVFGKDCNIKFRDINYDLKDGLKNPENVIFYSMSGWHKLRRSLGDSWSDFSDNIDLLDKIVQVISYEKSDEAIVKGLTALGLAQDVIKKLLCCNFAQFINLSLKAVNKLIPFLQQGLRYDEACEKVGYNFKESNIKLVDKKGVLLAAIPQDRLTSVAVVNRAVSQFRKVYNALARKYGVPSQINIEVAHDLKKSKSERDAITKKQEENRIKNEAVVDFLNSINIKVNAKNILKYKLYEEQGAKCIYSGKPIDIERLFEDNYVEIDHIIPYSRSLDDSFNNKALCLCAENQNKSNKTPFEYLSNDKWVEFESRVRLLRNRRKIDNLLNKSFKDNESSFKKRNSNDNSYIAKYIRQYCIDGIEFDFSDGIKDKVQVRSAFLIDYLRHRWGLVKDRAKDNKHHAQDAIVIACATASNVKKLSLISAAIETKYNNKEAWYKKIKTSIKEPWVGFRQDVLDSLDKVFVSVSPHKKVSGELHSETIYKKNGKIKSGFEVRGGIAEASNMLRVDVFSKNNQYYLVPIYNYDLRGKLPNKAIISSKSKEDWQEMDDSFIFKFSLYRNDLIKIKDKTREYFGYYKATDIYNGSIKIALADDSDTIRRRARNLLLFDKYVVDVLGNYTVVKKEKRLNI